LGGVHVGVSGGFTGAATTNGSGDYAITGNPVRRGVDRPDAGARRPHDEPADADGSSGR
jgi:hypothetical protein